MIELQVMPESLVKTPGPVFRVCGQVRIKPAYPVIQTSWNNILQTANLDAILSR